MVNEEKDTTVQTEIGYYGNIWVRSNYFFKKGQTNGGGHRHKFDHVSLLVKGSVEVEIEGSKPKQFRAPTFIVIDKNMKHKFTALEDDVLWYCVFAMRDVNGEITNIYSGDNSPYDAVPSEIEEKVKQLETTTVDED